DTPARHAQSGERTAKSAKSAKKEGAGTPLSLAFLALLAVRFVGLRGHDQGGVKAPRRVGRLHREDGGCHREESGRRRAEGDWRGEDSGCRLADSDWREADRDCHRADGDWREADSGCHGAEGDWREADGRCHRAEGHWRAADRGWREADRGWREADRGWREADRDCHGADSDWRARERSIWLTRLVLSLRARLNARVPRGLLNREDMKTPWCVWRLASSRLRGSKSREITTTRDHSPALTSTRARPIMEVKGVT
ncbi:MAG TPA: hypothetical protein VFF73_28170, partial [Planctomycetota bacterium]|nr:hypothetical protein [Planctomycetota bacterium]